VKENKSMNRKIIASETATIDPLQGQTQAIAGLHRQTGDLSSVPIEISIDAIERDEGLQARVKLDPDTITDYSEEMQHDTALPPIVVFHEDTEDDTRYWLADGWHRVAAALRLGAKSMLAIVLHGNRRDALIYAAGANAKNGLRRTSADKRKAVEMLLHDEELVTQSDSELGRIAGVDRITVSNVRKKLEASCEIHMIEEKQVTRR
jgi:ParB-like chromosome segregation protein Spo0J